jgi:hypothetical protein
MPVILPTQKAKIRRTEVQSQPREIVWETHLKKTYHQKKKKKRAGGVAQRIAPEFKPQYRKKKKGLLFFVLVLGVELRMLSMLGRHSTTELHPSPHYKHSLKCRHLSPRSSTLHFYDDENEEYESPSTVGWLTSFPFSGQWGEDSFNSISLHNQQKILTSCYFCLPSLQQGLGSQPIHQNEHSSSSPQVQVQIHKIELSLPSQGWPTCCGWPRIDVHQLRDNLFLTQKSILQGDKKLSQ